MFKNSPTLSLLIVLLLAVLLLPIQVIAMSSAPAITPNEHQPYREVGRPVARIFSPREHGGHNQNWTSMQNSRGMIYVGHTTGVSRWDGERWQNMPTPHTTAVRSISEWQQQLYVGTNNDIFKLEQFSNGGYHYQSLFGKDLAPPGIFGDIWSTAANSAGVVFVSNQHTFFFDGTRLHKVNEAISSSHSIFSLDNSFYYKPRHLAQLHKLKVVKNGESINFINTPLPIVLPQDARVMEVLPYKQHGFTIVTEQHGIYRYYQGQTSQRLTAGQFGAEVYLYDAIMASDGFYYVSSSTQGLFVLDAELNILRHYQEQDGISINTVLSVNEDHQGNIWLTGTPNIVKMWPPHTISQFKAGSNSTEILRLRDTRYGIFAAGNGVFKLTLPTDKRRTPAFSLIDDDIKASVDLLEYDNSLIKSGADGIFKWTLTEDGTAVSNEQQLLATGLSRVLLFDDGEQRLYASSNDGLFMLQPQAESWTSTTFAELSNQFTSLQFDEQENLWVGSATGALIKLRQITTQGSAADISVFTQADGLGPGPVYVFKVNNEPVFSSAGRLLTFYDGQLVNARLAMLPDDWLNGSKQIEKLLHVPATLRKPQRLWYTKDSRSGYFELQADDSWQQHTALFDSLPSGGFSDILTTDDNIVWFVRDKAEIYRVNLNLYAHLPPPAALNIHSLLADNQPVAFTLPTDSSTAVLPYQSAVRVHYASTDFRSNGALSYRTRLTGSGDQRWSLWSTESYRDYTQIAPGQHTFEVQARDVWGRVAQQQLAFTVATPWHLTLTAYSLYVISVLLAVFAITWAVQRWRTKALAETNRALELKVAERTAEVNDKVEQLRQQQLLKDRFFGNVSHEFRTPLTLTIAPLETLLTQHRQILNPDAAQLANMALNNATKMLALVGQVLDINRLEAGKMQLRVAQYDIADLLRVTIQRFQPWAEQNQQQLTLKDCADPLLAWFDVDQFSKCITNLLSNAIKYSGPKSQITLQLCSTPDHITVVVADNGVGISADAQTKIFERFYQGESSVNASAPGTGIGLSLVNELMALHHGSVQLVPTVAPGCRFELKLQTGKAHFHTDELVEPLALQQPAVLNLSSLNQAALPVEQADDNDDVTTLLIIDDNIELLNFLSLRLADSYRIIQATNGQEGYEKACKLLPDLIISDVNMPIMTGLELTQRLKSTKLTETIPIILLTAKATKREVVEGLHVGADDYLTKPFDTSELVMRVNAQIAARKLIRETLKASDNSSDIRTVPDSFADKLHSIIHQHFADPGFNVVKLASALYMSRDTLIRKCKSHCNDTPLNLIVAARLLRADLLLKQGGMSVSEVAYACGFESLSYFSKRYKQQRGIAPSDAMA